MTKITLFLGEVLILLFVFAVPVEAAGMRLTDGEFVVLGDDPSIEDYLNQFMFWDAVLEIDEKGKVKGNADTSFAGIKPTKYSGLVDAEVFLNMDGEYDYQANSLSGTFSAKHISSSRNEKEPPLISGYYSGTMTFTGTFSGGYSADDQGFLVTFTGTKHYAGRSWNSAGKEEEQDRSEAWSNKAVFSEDICASYSASAKSDQKRFSLLPAALARDSGARFTDFSGEVSVIPAKDPEDEFPAELDMVLEAGDTIVTQGDSCAIIGFADMSTFIMKPYSRVILEPAPERDNKIRLVAGKIWVNLKKIYETGHLDVTMNQAIAGTKGTTFVAEENGSDSTIKVLEGLMGYRMLAGGPEVDVAPGEMASIDDSGTIKKRAFEISSESSEWENQEFKARFASAPALDQNITNKAVPTEGIAGTKTDARRNKFAPFVGVISAVVITIFLAIFYRKRKSKK